jgi:hypothetical protein
MAVFSVAGIELGIASFREGRGRTRGEVTPAFDNTLRSSVSEEYRIFEATTGPMSAATKDSLQAAIANATPVDITGDAVNGATIECIVEASFQLFGTALASFEYVATLQCHETGT